MEPWCFYLPCDKGDPPGMLVCSALATIYIHLMLFIVFCPCLLRYPKVYVL